MKPKSRRWPIKSNGTIFALHDLSGSYLIEIQRKNGGAYVRASQISTDPISRHHRYDIRYDIPNDNRHITAEQADKKYLGSAGRRPKQAISEMVVGIQAAGVSGR